MENLHLIHAKYLGATNSRGSRVKLTSYRFNDSVTIPYDYGKNSIVGMACAWINERYGTDAIVGSGESPTGYIIALNVFEPLRGGK